MRFIEFKDGSLIIAPRRASAHKDMLAMARVSKCDVVSAGFLSARYEATEPWTPYGSSTGLGIKATNPDLRVPETLYVGKHRYGLVFATHKEFLEGLEDVMPATWGMTEESYWGDVCPVYAPLHPRHKLRADEAICD